MKIDNNNFFSELEARNPEAIEYIVREYGSLIKGVMHRYLYNSRESLDECFNDVLLSIWNNYDRFDDKKSNFKNWICAIAKYRAIDMLRCESKHRERFISIENDTDINWLSNFHVCENGIEIEDESVGELGKLIKCLSDEDKDLFFRRYVREQSVEEISQQKDMEPVILYSRFSRGKKKIRRYMECQNGGAIK